MVFIIWAAVAVAGAAVSVLAVMALMVRFTKFQ
jgi:hypothetical protein